MEALYQTRAKDSKGGEGGEIKLADMDETKMANIGDTITFLASDTEDYFVVLSQLRIMATRRFYS